uniref:Uncharacterized protein n=1 Tax=Arundo donax TaxID=35708 RepID=A0A0A9HH79_ARUDO
MCRVTYVQICYTGNWVN